MTTSNRAPADMSVPDGAPVLSVDGLRVAFEGRPRPSPAVDDVSFSVASGQTLGIVGESGSGKSVTALAVLGLVPPPGRVLSGSARIAGRTFDLRAPASLQPIRGAKVAMIFQEPMTALNPVMRVGDQIAESYRLHHACSSRTAWDAAAALLDRTGIARARARMADYPHAFSGGMRQRAMIAMALAGGPEVLIADEPTTALDVTVQAQILDLIKGVQKERGLAVVFVSHDLGVIDDIADDVLVMRSGRVVESGSTSAVLSSPRDAYTRTLLAARPRLVTGQSSAPAPPKPETPLLALKNIGFAFDRWSAPVISDASIAVAPGETVALIGESGSGKTTLARIAALLYRPNSGQILFQGENLTDMGSATAAFRRKVQMVFQDPFGSLDPRMTAGSIVAEPLDIHRIGTRRERADAVAALFQDVALDPAMASRYPHEFSGGQRQRIAIARALALKPALVIADEPVSALDVTVQAKIVDLFEALREKYGLAYLFISHDLAVVHRVAHRIAVMKNGSILETLPRDDFLERAASPYTRALIASVPGQRRRAGKSS